MIARFQCLTTTLNEEILQVSILMAIDVLPSWASIVATIAASIVATCGQVGSKLQVSNLCGIERHIEKINKLT